MCGGWLSTKLYTAFFAMYPFGNFIIFFLSHHLSPLHICFEKKLGMLGKLFINFPNIFLHIPCLTQINFSYMRIANLPSFWELKQNYIQQENGIRKRTFLDKKKPYSACLLFAINKIGPLKFDGAI